MIEPIKVAIVGYGMSAKVFHAPLLNCLDEFEIVAIHERTKSESKKDFPNIEIFRDFKIVLSDDNIELVVITTPNQWHYSQAKAALLAGKHVVVEKPFTVSVMEAEKLIALAEKVGKTLAVFHNRRWDSDFIWLKELVNSDVKIYEIESRFDRFRDYIKGWKELEGEGNGILYDLGSHLIDQMLVLFGDQLKLTYVDLQKQRKVAEADDNFEIQFKANGIKIILKASMTCSHSYRLKVDTEKGTYIKKNPDVQEGILKELGVGFTYDKVIDDEILHYQPNGLIEAVKLEKGKYTQFYKELFQTIRQGKTIPVHPLEATKVMALIEKCVAKSKEMEKRN